MRLPKPIEDVVESFEMLPGIGPKTAQRLAFYLLRLPSEDLKRIARSFSELKEKTLICKNCFNVSEKEVCEICDNLSRDQSMICVVENPLDLIAIEKSGYKGVYHVLHGVINPLAGIGPEEIFIPQLINRVSKLIDTGSYSIEVIVATGTSLEGDMTSMYINREINKQFEDKIKITRIGKGLPIGADIEFADEQTISDALNGRVKV